MLVLAAASYLALFLNLIILVLSLFLILLVLIQRGKGGGLAGAFGGAGGSSPFGSRAGDAFTRFTIIVATIWVLFIIAQVKVVQGTTTAESVPVVGLTR